MFRSAPLLLTTGLAGLALAACSYTDYGGDSERVNTYEELTCDDAGCYVCDAGFCEEYRCERTDQCPKGRACSADGRCVPGAGSGGPSTSPDGGGDSNTDGNPGCTAHADCAEGEICLSDGACVKSPGASDPGGDPGDGGEEPGGEEPGLPDHPGDRCVLNADCSDGICLDGGCYFPCDATGACPPGQACNDAGQCLPAAAPEVACTFNAECGPERLCIEGECYLPCQESFECPDHHRCEGELCVADTSPVIQCSGPASCAEAEGCVDGKCLATCQDATDCGGSEVCQFGYCHRKVECTASAECDNGRCLDGKCQ